MIRITFPRGQAGRAGRQGSGRPADGRSLPHPAFVQENAARVDEGVIDA